MRKTDISKYSDERSASSVSAGSVVGGFFGILGKLLATAVLVSLITGLVVAVSMLFYIINIANEPTNIDLEDMKLNEIRQTQEDKYHMISFIFGILEESLTHRSKM
jgi:hypothetical protein